MAEYKVIFHISEEGKWASVLANVKNLLADLGSEHVNVMVLANGHAVRYLAETSDSESDLETMQNLSESGVHFTACNNSLRAQKINREGLYEFVGVVPAGVSELVKRQHEGYAYIKP